MTATQTSSLFLSPHLDDAVLSCGGRLALNARAGSPQEVVTLFAGSPSRPPEAARRMSARRAEDRAALLQLGLGDCAVHFDWLDGIFRCDPRGVRTYDPRSMCGPVSSRDVPLASELAAAVAKRWPEPARLVVFAPLGVGRHVDHQLTHRAARKLARRGYSVQYYEDFPYSLAAGSLSRALRSKLGWAGEELALDPWQLELKLASLRHYRSQIPALFGDDAGLRRALLATSPVGDVTLGSVERVWFPT